MTLSSRSSTFPHNKAILRLAPKCRRQSRKTWTQRKWNGEKTCRKQTHKLLGLELHPFSIPAGHGKGRILQLEDEVTSQIIKFLLSWWETTAQKGLHLCYETIWDFVRLLQFSPGMRVTSSNYAFYCKCHRWSFANNLKITIKERMSCSGAWVVEFTVDWMWNEVHNLKTWVFLGGFWGVSRILLRDFG